MTYLTKVLLGSLLLLVFSPIFAQNFCKHLENTLWVGQVSHVTELQKFYISIKESNCQNKSFCTLQGTVNTVSRNVNLTNSNCSIDNNGKAVITLNVTQMELPLNITSVDIKRGAIDFTGDVQVPPALAIIPISGSLHRAE